MSYARYGIGAVSSVGRRDNSDGKIAPSRTSAGVPPVLHLQAAAGNRATTLILQRQSAGYRAVATPFGRMIVVPDGRRRPARLPSGEVLTASQLQEALAVWSELTSGRGQVRIFEDEPLRGVTHRGFRDRVLAQLAILMGRRRGRSLITDLVRGSHRVQIVPHAQVVILADGGEAMPVDGQQQQARNPRQGADAIIRLDPAVHNRVTVVDANGAALPNPAFIAIGHELIHARHITRGQLQHDRPARNPAYDNREEEETIETGDITENDLREEHRVGAPPAGGPTPRRFGHGGSSNPLPPMLGHSR